MISDNTSGPRAKRAAPLSSAELQALAYWRTKHGRFWKAELRRSWADHAYGGVPSDHPALLHGLRNRLGLKWLDQFHLDHAIKEGSR